MDSFRLKPSTWYSVAKSNRGGKVATFLIWRAGPVNGYVGLVIQRPPSERTRARWGRDDGRGVHGAGSSACGPLVRWERERSSLVAAAVCAWSVSPLSGHAAHSSRTVGGRRLGSREPVHSAGRSGAGAVCWQRFVAVRALVGHRCQWLRSLPPTWVCSRLLREESSRRWVEYKPACH